MNSPKSSDSHKSIVSYIKDCAYKHAWRLATEALLHDNHTYLKFSGGFRGDIIRIALKKNRIFGHIIASDKMPYNSNEAKLRVTLSDPDSLGVVEKFFDR